MTFKNYLSFSWVPILLALTITVTVEPQQLSFDSQIFACCLIISLGHFYLTHFAGARYFVVHNSSKKEYWKISSISYIPLILSLWIFFALNAPDEFNIDYSKYGVLILGLLLSSVLFAVLIIKKVRMDLDAVLALLFIIMIAGAITLWFFTWLVLSITEFR